jgi:hypothetical protein
VSLLLGSTLGAVAPSDEPIPAPVRARDDDGARIHTPNRSDDVVSVRPGGGTEEGLLRLSLSNDALPCYEKVPVHRFLLKIKVVDKDCVVRMVVGSHERTVKKRLCPLKKAVWTTRNCLSASR